jgi:O-antigen/teichoic acid export membrane protein
MTSFAWTSGGRFMLQATNLVALMVTSRFIAPAEFGLFAPVAIIASLAYAASDGTFATALMQRNELKDDHVRVSFWASVITSVATAALLVLCAPLVERGFGFPGLAAVIAVSSFTLPARLVAAVPTALLQREMRFRALALVTLSTSIVGKMLPTIVLAIAGYGVWALVIGYLIQAYLDVAILLYLARPAVAWPKNWRSAHDVLNFGGRFMAIQSINQLALNIDNVLIGRLLGPVALGFYSRIFAIMMMPVNLLGGSAQQVLFPRFSRLQSDLVALKKELYFAIDLVSGFIMPLSALLAIVTDSLVLLVLGETWAEVILPARILLLTITFRIGYKVTETISFATASLMPALVRQTGYAALIALGTLVGSRWGLPGVACGVATALLLFYVSSLHGAARLVDGRWRTLAFLHLRGFVITALAAAPATALSSLGSSNFSSRLAADVGAALIFCLITGAIMFKGPQWLRGASSDVVIALFRRASRVVKTARTPQPVET